MSNNKIRNAHTYSNFFETLYDEEKPIGIDIDFHYSILQAVVLSTHDRMKLFRFGVIWDEDHDSRIIDTIEEIYFAGLLPHFLFFYERKGNFFAITRKRIYSRGKEYLTEKIDKITQSQDDPWETHIIRGIDDADNLHGTPTAKERFDIKNYLKNIKLMWRME